MSLAAWARPQSLGSCFLTVAVVTLAGTVAPACASQSLQLAVGGVVQYADGAELPLSFARVRAAGASSIRLDLSWKAAAPNGVSKPPGFDSANPADPAYDWQAFDGQVRLARSLGLEPIVNVTTAPVWAERPGVARGRPGTVNPNPTEYGRFAQAAARRYSGGFQGLPRVRRWEAWNETNASFFLSPQRVGGKLYAADLYRKLVNSFASAVHRVHPDNTVIAGATFPFTVERPGVTAIGPLRFMRALFCLTSRLRLERPCPGPLHIDVWSHHPYTSGGPDHRAGGPDSVSLGDLPRMRRVLRAAVRLHRVVPRGSLRFWVTEFGWDTSPPDPKGVPLNLQARWVSKAIFRMWRAGVSLITWWALRDQPDNGRPNPEQVQSGLYFNCPEGPSCDRPKPTLQAFRFPFVALRERGRVLVWGHTPDGRRGRVLIERSIGSGWRLVRSMRTDRHGIFLRRVRGPRQGSLRARLEDGSASSLSFPLTRLPDLDVNPFG